MSKYEKVIRALEEIRNGRMVILVDDEDRENEGDLCMAAELVTPEAINFMAREGRGLICLTLTEEKCDQLELAMMVKNNKASLGTAFTVSVEAAYGVTTGISAQDRAVTVRAAVSRDAKPSDLVSPGHIFPLRAQRGGVLVRTGQTEGSVDLARLAGLEPAGVICEIMRDDGEMARMPDLEEFGKKHNVAVVSVADLIEYRLRHERLVERTRTSVLRPALLGGKVEFVVHVYESRANDNEYMAFVLGDPTAATEPPLVRVQTANLVGDVFGPGPESSEHHLRTALRSIAQEGVGVFLYVYPRNRSSLVRSFDRLVGDEGEATSPERLRDFGLGAQVLTDLGLTRIRLMTNHPRRIVGLTGFGIDVVEHVPLDATVATPASSTDTERRAPNLRAVSDPPKR